MPKAKMKDEKIEVCMTEDQKKQVRQLAELSHKSMSEFILEATLSTSLSKPSSNDDSFRELTVLLKKQFKDIKSFQHQQQIMMYIIVQFAMFIASASQSRDEIMEFYEDAYKGAIEKFGKEE